jgi:protein O-mannosyl-transferase
MSRNWVVIVWLVLATAGVYSRVATHGFVNYDDNDYVTDNAHVKAGLTAEGVSWAFGNLHGEKTYYHPLTWLSHMLDCQIFGLNPAGHHLMSLGWHLVNVALLFLVLKRLTGEHWASAVIAGLFALHPLQVDSVAWVTERKNLLSAFFWILAMGAYARYAERVTMGRYLALALCMTLGLLTKPILVTLPTALLLLDFWPLRRWKGMTPREASEKSLSIPQFGLWSLIYEKIPLLGLSIVSSVITLAAHNSLGMSEERYGLPFSLRVENAVVSYARYLGKIFWPADLSVLYLHPGQWPAARVWASAALLVAITALALARMRRSPWLLVGWLWFLGTLVPAIGLRQVGVQAMADRFVYVPILGVFVMVVWSAAELARRWKLETWALRGATILLVGLGLVSTFQLRHWRDSLALWEQALAVDPNNYLAHGNLAVSWTGKGDLVKARRHAEEATRIRPATLEPRLQLALIATKEKKFEEAQHVFAEALRLGPGTAPVIYKVTDSIAALGRLQEAIDYFKSYALVATNDAQAPVQLGMMFSAAHLTAEAIEQYEQALRLNPESAQALNNLAWIYATAPEEKFRYASESARLAELACELTGWREPVLLGTLAAAYAESDDFPKAVRLAQQAIDMALAAGLDQVAAMNKKLIELYQEGKPYRQESVKRVP